jgi:hypothetical protein
VVADRGAPAARPDLAAPGSDQYDRRGPARDRGAAAGNTAWFDVPGDDWADGGIAGPAAGRPAAGPPDQPRRFGRRARGDRPGRGGLADDTDRHGRRGPGDGTGPMRQASGGARTEPGGGADERGGYGHGRRSRDPADDRGPTGTGSRRAVKVRPGRATDLLFNPAAEDYSQPLYPPGDDHGLAYPPAAPASKPASPPRPGRRPDEPFTSPQRRLDTAEYAQPLYPGLDAGPASGTRARPAWPGDPLSGTGTRGRTVPGEARPARGRRTGRATPALPGPERAEHTGPQRRVDGPGGADPLARPRRPARTGPQPRVDAQGGADPLTAPRRSAGTGPQPRVDALGGADPLTASRRSAGTGPQRQVDALTDSGVGVLWPAEQAPASAAAAAPETAITSAPVRRTDTGPLDRPPFDTQGPGAARKPRKKPGKKAAASKSKARPGAPKPGKGRPRPGRRRKVAALLLGGLVIVAGLAAAGYYKLMPRTSHVVSTPAAVGSFLKQQANATAKDLKHRIMVAAAGDVKNVVAAVYEQKKGPGTSKGPQIVVFIGGNLTGNASASDLITAYMTRLHGAFATSAGRLGGQAACAPGANGGPAECAWADSDTFGVIVSATLTSAGLADEMRQLRPLVEHVAK